MTKTDKELIARSWVERYQISTTKAETQWAYDKLDDLITINPKLALEIIIVIFNKTNDEFVLDNLAAGPLENLLVRHGNEIITDIEKYTLAHPKFSDVLAGIWSNGINASVLAKINSLLDRFQADE